MREDHDMSSRRDEASSSAGLPLAIRDYLHDLWSRAAHDPASVSVFEHERWISDPDGYIRPRSVRQHVLSPKYALEHSLASYQAADAALRADRVLGLVLDKIVGTSNGASPVRSEWVLRALASTIIGEDGGLAVREDIALRTLDEYRALHSGAEHQYQLVIPLRGVSLSTTFALEDDVELGPLTGEEIDGCVHMGLLKPVFGARMIDGADCVGIRFHLRNRLVIFDTPDDIQSPPAVERHQFGDRSSAADDAGLVDDVLLAVRLALRVPVLAAGALRLETRVGSHSLGAVDRPISHRGPGERREIDEASASQIRALWTQLRQLAARGRLPNEFAVRRFNTAMDRRTLDDTILDLIIAAEALYLHDAGAPEDRGELSYRLALRAAVLLRDTGRSPRSTFKFMKRAYTLRSRIAHGHSIGSAPIRVGEVSWDAPQFVNELFFVLCDSFLSAIDIASTADEFGNASFWEDLTLGSSAEP